MSLAEALGSAQVFTMRSPLRKPQPLTLALLVALALGCGRAPMMRVERINFDATADALPGWEAAGDVAAEVGPEGLRLPAEAQMVRVCAEDDYPVALHLDVSLGGAGAGLAVVTRAAGGNTGPLGLPRRGVAFVVWEEGVLAQQPFNVALLWIDGDRLIPLDRGRWPALARPATLDVYDDGRWVLLAIDGEVIAAATTPDYALPDFSALPRQVRGYAEQSSAIVSTLRHGSDTAGGDVVLAVPRVAGADTAQAEVSALTLLRGAPVKTGEERERWEEMIRPRQRRWPRPVAGHLRDADTGDPIAGAVLVTRGGRRLTTDIRGRFLDTRPMTRTGEAWTLTVEHPDYPTQAIQRIDAHDLSAIDERLPREGTGEIALTIERAAPITAVTLRPAGGGPGRTHGAPGRGPLRFRHLPAGEWVAEVNFDDPARAIFVSEPFTVTDNEDQRHTVRVTP